MDLSSPVIPARLIAVSTAHLPNDRDSAFEYLRDRPPTPVLTSSERAESSRLVVRLQQFICDLQGVVGTASKRHSRLLKRSDYDIGGGTVISSWRCDEWAYVKNPASLPTPARGLFTQTTPVDDCTTTETHRIVARGYNKFFSVEEVAETHWRQIQTNTFGPYQVTLKENGCILFASTISPTELVVTSKNAIETVDRADAGHHAAVGRKWLRRHLDAAHRTEADLAAYLYEYSLTAVFELCDDAFEEHILEYPADRAGLYLHGVNRNTPELCTWPQESVRMMALAFGFRYTEHLNFDTSNEVKAYTDAVGAGEATADGRPIEGFVIRCRRKLKDSDVGEDFLFKVKYDEPYLMYREWREITRRLLSKASSSDAPFYWTYSLSKDYVAWVRLRIHEQPEWFAEYQKNRGIINVRKEFLKYWTKHGDGRVASAKKSSAALKDRVLCISSKGNDGESVHTIGVRRPPKPSMVDHIVLIPVAIVGTGKTTLGQALYEIFGWSHVQSDNIKQKKTARLFEQQVIESMASSRVVFADRNNHEARHREELCQAIRKQYPDAYLIALDLASALDRSALFALAHERVVGRGERHQSVTPSMDFEHVIWRFQNGFCSPLFSRKEDMHLDEIEVIDPTAPLEEKVRLVATIACSMVGVDADTMLTESVMTLACEAALNYNPIVRKPQKPVSATYYGVKIDQDLLSQLCSYVECHPELDGRFLRYLIKTGQAKLSDFHVTLVHRTQLRNKDKDIAARAELHWKQCKDAGEIASNGRIDGVIWNDETMALVVGSLEPRWLWEARDSSAEVPSHVTIGTRDPTIKAVTAKYLVERAWNLPADQMDEGTVVVRFPESERLEFTGTLCGMVSR